jgi:hypothetical protein|tara:strand:- start:206 stop:484 length:279 start_codon:yes stop_codon:yes gene_type:complete
MIKKITIIILSILIIILPTITNKLKFSFYLLGSNNIISQLLISNLILFTLLENLTIGILLLLLFITILTFKKNNVIEGFNTYYKKNNINIIQ